MNLEKVKSELPSIVSAALKQVPFIMQPFIAESMSFSSSGSGILPKNNTSALRLVGGKLFQSFIPGKQGNIFTEERNGRQISIKYGTSIIYAPVHEHGGFIKSKGKMAAWMFHQADKTNNEAWRYMALSVLKNGGVQIPKRPYFMPAVDRFKKEGYSILLNAITNAILKAAV